LSRKTGPDCKENYTKAYFCMGLYAALEVRNIEDRNELHQILRKVVQIDIGVAL